jgi:hypothetical protein
MHHPVQHLFVSSHNAPDFFLSAAAERARRSPRRAVPLRNNEREHLLLNAHFLMRNVRF